MTHASVSRAIGALLPTDTVVLGHCEPRALVREICAQRHRLAGLELMVWPLTSDPLYLRPENRTYFRVRAFSGTPMRILRETGLGEGADVQYLPTHSTRLNSGLAARGRSRLVVLAHTSELAGGVFPLGLAADHVHAMSGMADLVIAEVNDKLPTFAGPNGIPADCVSYVVHSSEDVLFVEHSEPDDVDVALAEHVAMLVPDGATVEVGVGNGGTSIWRALRARRRLGIHSGMFTRDALDLVSTGVVTNDLKPLNNGASVAACFVGDMDFLRSLDSRPDIEMWPNSYTHDVDVIGQLPKFRAINSALQIDLSGHVYSERVGRRVIGATGGLVDFTRGAARSKGGLSIVTVRATSRRGNPTGFVASGEPGDLVTLTHNDVECVVSEFGVADLRDLTLSERAEAIVSIAHPDARDHLRRHL